MLTLLFSIFTAQASELIISKTWEVKPTILICPESKITSAELEKAINYWKFENNVSFNYNKIVKVNSCSQKIENTIQITDGSEIPNNGTIALTRISVYGYANTDKEFISHSRVRIPNDVPNNLRQDGITHEIGHAIGLEHSNHEIMKSHF